MIQLSSEARDFGTPFYYVHQVIPKTMGFLDTWRELIILYIQLLTCTINL